MPLPVRFITVTAVSRVTPRMARVTFGGAALADFVLDAPDRQVKLYVPRPGQARPVLPSGDDGDLSRWYGEFLAIPEETRPWMRSYTVRGHDPAQATIDIDFVLHGDRSGPATRWAARARPGDTIGMFGPSADFARPAPIMASVAAADWFLLAGDETALPAIGTLVEALPPGGRAVAFVEVADPAEQQRLTTGGGAFEVRWVHRSAGENLVDVVRAAAFPAGRPFAWIGGEAGAVRALRRHLVDERGVPKRAIDFTGNWRRRLSQDDAPTEADLADAGELVEHAQALAASALGEAAREAPGPAAGEAPGPAAGEAAGATVGKA